MVSDRQAAFAHWRAVRTEWARRCLALPHDEAIAAAEARKQSSAIDRLKTGASPGAELRRCELELADATAAVALAVTGEDRSRLTEFAAMLRSGDAVPKRLVDLVDAIVGIAEARPARQHARGTLDERAVALLKMWLAAERRFTLDEIATQLGTKRQSLTGKVRGGRPRCPLFLELWNEWRSLHAQRRRELAERTAPVPRARRARGRPSR